MKLQGISVIFALIVLPLILVLSYYIELQVDTIQRQNEYDKRLLDSTYGAMSAFEINTANEDLSSVSDSLRTIIEASTNVFITTLATNHGMSNASKSYLEPYLPAILYTLYDGYYISSPTKSPIVLTDSDGNAVSVGDAGVTAASGGVYTFTQVHTSQESENNCTTCADPANTEHIRYATYIATSNQTTYYIEYTEANFSNKEDYAQLLYLKNGTTNTYTTNINDAAFETKHILKSYMPYSARYKNDKCDITVIYTLDNYVTIEGTIKHSDEEVYYTKSGYLIPDGKISVITPATTGAAGFDLLSYNQEDAKKYVEAGNNVTIEINDGNNTQISSGGNGTYAEIEQKIIALNTKYERASSYYKQLESYTLDDLRVMAEFLGTGIDPTGINAATDISNGLQTLITDSTQEINRLQYELDKMSAVTYYVTAEIFSDWVYANLVGSDSSNPIVKESDLVEISGQTYKSIKGQDQVTYKFESNDSIFDLVGTTDGIKSKLNSVIEVDRDSTFYTHKLNVIRNSIQYNLNLSMSTYNDMSDASADYSMPVMENAEWEKILNNVSIVSFMQGYDCGLKKYNNYMIVSSTNNEISVTPENIYYVEKTEFSDEETAYHRIDCPKLFAKDSGTTNEYIAFTSKEVKYDKIYDKTNALIPYQYDHKNYACYDCINDGNYEGCKIFDTTDANYSNYQNLRKTYYIGIGKSRNNLYKMNAVTESDGYEIIYNKPESSVLTTDTSILPLGKIKSIEIVFNKIESADGNENATNYKISTSGLTNADGSIRYLNDQEYTIIPNVTTGTTIKIKVNPNIDSTSLHISLDNLIFECQGESHIFYKDDTGAEINDPNVAPKKAIKYIRVIYR